MVWIVLAIIVLLVVFVVGIYNGLVTARNGYKNAFAQIDVQLTRRHDLIPNLVETAKGYLAHERQTLEAVINGAQCRRTRASRRPRRIPATRPRCSTRRRRERALRRARPPVRARRGLPGPQGEPNMMQLSEELTTTENKVAFARQAYNDSVMGYNNRREMFPGSVVANMFAFSPAQLLEIESPAKREVPAVSFT